MKSKKKFTSIFFNFIPDNTKYLKNYFSLISLDIDKNIFKNFNHNELKYYSNVKEENIYYNEIISFYSNDNTLFFSIYYPIYINKINNIYIDSDKLINKDNLPITAEIIFQGINRFFLPKNIVYDNKKLYSFDYFQNLLKKRMTIINFNPKKCALFEKLLNFDLINGNSYKIILRFYTKNNFEISATDFELIDDKDVKKKLKQFQGNKIDVISNLKGLCKDFKLLLENINKSMKINENDIQKFNEDYLNKFALVDIYYEKMNDYNNFDKSDIEIFHYLFYYKEVLLFMKMKKDKIDDLLYLVKFFEKLNLFYEKRITDITNENFKNIKDYLSLIKAYNCHFLNSLKTSTNIDYISFINIEKLQKNNPYFIAVNFVKDIINNLEEKSRLFEILSSLDSEAIKNLLVENKNTKTITYKDIYNNTRKVKYDKNPTEYGLNLLNINEIKEHLIKILPKYVIRLNSDMKFRANCILGSNIMSINEKSLFKKDSKYLDTIFEKNNSNEAYAIPIIIEILHELYGHYKKRLINSRESSPLEIRDSKSNYARIKIMKIVKKLDEQKEKINFPESGIALENYISENPKIIKRLKTPCFNNKDIIKILDVSLWVDINFINLENLVNTFISQEGDNASYNNNENTENQDFDSDDSELYDCGFVGEDFCL